MADLVSELLNISRIQAGTFIIKPSMSNLGELTQNIIKQFQQIKPNRSNDIKLILPENLKETEIDKEKIRMVIYNLLDNALKYSPNGQILLTIKQNNEETEFSIKDEGVGIPEEDFEKLFQPFFRGKNILELDNKGTGLGLYIARLIVEAHGGKIWAQPKINKGSEFIFSLPNQITKEENK